MPVKVHNTNDIPVNVSEMKSGDIAKIVQWGDLYHHVGEIVQRYKNTLFILSEDNGWSDFKNITKEKDDDCKVVILPKNTVFQLVI